MTRARDKGAATATARRLLLLAGAVAGLWLVSWLLSGQAQAAPLDSTPAGDVLGTVAGAVGEQASPSGAGGAAERMLRATAEPAKPAVSRNSPAEPVKPAVRQASRAAAETVAPPVNPVPRAAAAPAKPAVDVAPLAGPIGLAKPAVGQALRVEAARTAAPPVSPAARSAATGLVASVGDAVEPLSRTVQPVSRVVRSAVVPVVKPVVGAAVPVVEPVVRVAASVVEPVANAAVPVVRAVEPVLRPVSQVVRAAGPVLRAVAPLVEPVAGIVRAVAPVLDPVLGVVRPVVSPVLGVARPVLEPVAGLAPPATRPAGNVLAPAVIPVVERVAENSPALERVVPLPDPSPASVVPGGSTGLLAGPYPNCRATRPSPGDRTTTTPPSARPGDQPAGPAGNGPVPRWPAPADTAGGSSPTAPSAFLAPDPGPRATWAFTRSQGDFAPLWRPCEPGASPG